MCNPPGGDWSGISLVDTSHGKEYRWLVLPRVTAQDAKRPDHVFQEIQTSNGTLALVIESKDNPRSLERGIGPRLIRYMKALAASSPNVVREQGSLDWSHCERVNYGGPSRIASVAAAIIQDVADLQFMASHGDVDVACGCMFSAGGTCNMHIRAVTTLGEEVVNIVRSIAARDIPLRIHAH